MNGKNPFYGSAGHFLRMVWQNGPYHGTYTKLIVFIFRSLLLSPSSLWEQLFRARDIEERRLQPQPLILLGHYRSGTTLLHKILARDPQFIFLNGIDCILPFAGDTTKRKLKPFLQRIFRLLKIKNFAFRNYDFQPEDPVEEDAFMIYANCPYSVFWGLIFPRRAQTLLPKYIQFQNGLVKENWKEAYLFLCKKISGKGGGKSLLLKSPPNTGRISTLLEIFPNARFIHIVRNPYHVYSSMWNLVVENIDRFYALHPTSVREKQEIIFSHYRLLMDRLESDKALLDPSKFIEIRYENLLENPLAILQSIYEHLNLGSFSEIEPHLREVLKKEAKYSPRSHDISSDIQIKIEEEWGHHIRYWGYDKPL